jgi:hypothetical protein
MIPDTTYEIHQYWRNQKRIDCLTPVNGGAAEYYVMMQVKTPAGLMTPTARVEADSIEAAYTLAPEAEARVLEEINAKVNGIVTATQIPGSNSSNRLPGNGPLPGGIILP